MRIPSPSVTQAETFILLLHILKLCKGNRFLDNLRRISCGPITPVGQIDSKFKLVSFIALPVFISACIVTKAYVVAQNSSLHRTYKVLSVNWFIAILRIAATLTRPSVAPQRDRRQDVWSHNCPCPWTAKDLFSAHLESVYKINDILINTHKRSIS